MEWKELEKKSATEIQALLKEAREKVRDLRFKISQQQWKKVREIREEKKTIARMLMLLNVSAGEKK